MKSTKWKECRKHLQTYFDEWDHEDFGKVIVLSAERAKRQARAAAKRQRLSRHTDIVREEETISDENW